MAGENIKVTLQTVAPEGAGPGEIAVEVTLTNTGTAPETLDLSNAHIPSLALEIRDAAGNPVRMPPPPVPKAEDARSATLAPGQSHRIPLTLPFDAHQPGGSYQVRFRHGAPAAFAAASVVAAHASEWTPVLLKGGATARVSLEAETQPTRTIEPRAWWLRWPTWWLACLRCLILRPRCNKVASIEVDRAVSETITDAPPPNQAWNGTYDWNARFQLSLDQPHCRITITVRLRLVGTITAAQQTAWKTAIETKWGNVFKLCCSNEEECCTCCAAGYLIQCQVQFVTSGEHQVVNVGSATTDMNNWSATDTIDITHEFGHMLGNKEEYFTVDGTVYGTPRRADGNVMNNPANGAAASHFNLIRTQAQTMIGPGTHCVVKGVGESCT